MKFVVEMNLMVFGRSMLVLGALALISFALHPYINSALGVKESIFNSAWQTIALAIGLSIVVSLAYPHVRGVQKGDTLVGEVPRARSVGHTVMAFVESAAVVALEGGRQGHKIRVRLPNGKSAEGIIVSYAGTFSPAFIKITETEV